jgi:hypothetical protein
VQGIVTAPLGRVLDERTIVLQDETGGLPIRLAGPGPEQIGLGERITARGRLHDPYGNLELRVDASGFLFRDGQGRVPTPRSISASELGEELEGLFVRLKGTVRSVDRSSSGSVSIDVEDDSGVARIFVHRMTPLPSGTPERGARVEVCGIAGQRATGRDRPDGYRLWPREAADLRVVQSGDASPTPRPSAEPTPHPSDDDHGSPSADPGDPGRALPIRDALRRPGSSATVEGVATTGSGLVDGDGRRVVLEDGSGAILLRLPLGDGPVTAGSRLRARGLVATYFGAPQLELDGPPSRLGTGALPAPVSIAEAPIPAALEWRLARAAGRLSDVERDGDSWRAELLLSDGRGIPVRGRPASGIDPSRLTEGATAEVIGVVRRAHPTASDQRFGLLPRSVGDLRLTGSGGPTSSGGSGAGNGREQPTSTGWSPGSVQAGLPEAGPIDVVPLDAGLAELSRYEGRLVRIGGRVRGIDRARLELEDGTGRGEARFPGSAEAVLGAVTLGEVVNVTGRVERDKASWLVEAGSGADLARVGALSAGAGSVAPDLGGPSAGPSAPPRRNEEIHGELSARSPTASLALALLVLVGLGLLGLGAGLRRGRLALLVRQAKSAIPAIGRSSRPPGGPL